MEYGAAETVLMAHPRPASGFDVFWNTYLIDTEPFEDGHQLYVTSLYPRCFSLVRYAVGDEVRLSGPAGDAAPRPVAGLQHFTDVLGRCDESVTLPLPGGEVLHSEFFTHAVRSCSQVRGFQVVQRGADLRIQYLTPATGASDADSGTRHRLACIHPTLRNIPLERADRLVQTIAGKTRMIVQE